MIVMLMFIMLPGKALPLSHKFALAAKRRDSSDSAIDDSSGEMLTNISALESPARDCCQI